MNKTTGEVMQLLLEDAIAAMATEAIAGCGLEPTATVEVGS
jgi:hypothetical protein